ncbi:MAG: M20/M25/M40 family metallo-hydrolase [Rikenellaceae bacterium]|nr:M20/M25/M40 family metallo-hydrolase [Rikenellaceae bacterium]
MHKTICTLLLLLSVCQLFAQSRAKEIRDLRRIVGYLASAELGGRFPGTRGDTLAADFIVGRLGKAGLTPWYETWFQPFSLPGTKRIDGANSLSIGGRSLDRGSDYQPLPFSASGRISGEVVYAGMGTRGGDLQGKCALLLVPPPGHGMAGRDESPASALRNRALEAQDRGAAAVLFVSMPDTPDSTDLSGVRESPLRIPAVRLDRAIAVEIFGRELLTPPAAMHPMSMSAAVPTGLQAALETTIRQDEIPARNIVAWLPGSDPGLKDEYIIIGAHYDHLGLGGPGSGSRRPDTTAVHPGADDNASGIAALLTLARHLRKAKPARSVIFAAFSAEEEGVVGSRHFTANLPVDSSLVSAMFNIDMVGSLRASALTVGGSGTSAESDSLIRAHAAGSGLHVTCSPQGHGPSDHAPFYAKGIPVFYFTTGGTMTYHTPGDQPATINYEGMDSVIRYVAALATDVANRPARLSFRESGPANAAPMRAQFKVTLGLMPDVTGSSNDGLRADIVVKGKPADRAGMRTGDVIVEVDGKSVSNIEDYMARLAQLRAGTTIDVKVRRGDETLVLKVEL